MDPEHPYLSPFRPGMSATVDIRTHSEVNVLTVPIMSVTVRTIEELKNKKEGNREDEKPVKDEEGENTAKKEETKTSTEDEVKEIVFVLESGKVKPVEVKTGIQDNNYIQILSGLKEGQEVISGPYSAISKILKEGTEVEKTTTEKLNQRKEE
jgi:HlyD family secretion protein